MPRRAVLRIVLPGLAAAAGLGVALARGELPAAAALAGSFALGHAFPLRTTAGRLQPLSPAIAAAAALLGLLAPAAAGAAVGLPVGWLIARWRHGERASADVLPGEAAGMAAFSLVFGGLDSLLPDPGSAWMHLSLVVPAGGAWHLASSAARIGWSESRRRFAVGLLWRTALGDWPPYLVQTSAGGLFAVTYDDMGWWAVLLAGLPYAFSHLAFTRLTAAATTYDQTIRALGRVPEAGGFALPGHAERTADIAVAMGGELGLAPAEIRRLEQAALLADIGRVVLGAPALASGGAYTTADLAHWSAAIVGEAPILQPVAAIVAETHRPHQRPGEERDAGTPRAAQVVKVATAYDYAAGGGMEPASALDLLHRGLGDDYDPQVVTALRRVLQRRGVPGV